MISKLIIYVQFIESTEISKQKEKYIDRIYYQREELEKSQKLYVNN